MGLPWEWRGLIPIIYCTKSYSLSSPSSWSVEQTAINVSEERKRKKEEERKKEKKGRSLKQEADKTNYKI
jgi:hypothetical protein